ncbi:MAG: Zn-dependent exopeptidase M28 [Bacteroidota bacterium]
MKKLLNIIGIFVLFLGCSSQPEPPTELFRPNPPERSDSLEDGMPKVFLDIETIEQKDSAITVFYSFENSNLKDSTQLNVTVLAKLNGSDDYENITNECSGDVGSIVYSNKVCSFRWVETSKASKLKIIVDFDMDFSFEGVLESVSKHRIKDNISAMEGIRHHKYGKNLLKETRTLIEEEFRNQNIVPWRHTFDYSGTMGINPGTTGINIIGSIVGIDSTSSQRMVVCAHYDSVGNSPGADDNASGVAGILEVMRVLSKYAFNKSIDFIAFDLEEVGLRGSRAYANDPKNNLNILGLINFEMIGYTCRSKECEHMSSPDKFIFNIAVDRSSDLQEAFNTMAEAYVPNLEVYPVYSNNESDHRRSDHAPFWDKNIPALFITDGANHRNPHYHRTTDTSGTLDYDFASNIVKTTVATILEGAEVITSIEKEVDLD